jgi:hypothetical protein
LFFFSKRATAGGILVGLSLIAIGLLGFKVGSRGKALGYAWDFTMVSDVLKIKTIKQKVKSQV